MQFKRSNGKQLPEQMQNRSLVDPRVVRSVCVLGRGVTGDAVVAYFESLSTPPSIQVFADDGEVSGSFDLGIVSPGIPPHSTLFTSAKKYCGEVIGEPELAYRLSPERWCVVTGTNGKTTTTALLAHLLNAAGIKARVAGNIGTTCIEAITARAADEYIVAELSSYQLAYSSTIAPAAAILLNITPDHLSWHGSFEAYRTAKLGLLERMDPAAPVVIDATLEETRSVVRARREAGLRVIPLGTADGLQGDMTAKCGAPESAFIDHVSSALSFVIDGGRIALLGSSELLIKGEHNRENALAAAAVALALGARPPRIAAGLADFEPLEHRIEPCGTVAGVGFFNDSKATNPEATLTALASFEGTPLVVLLGGRDKNTSLDELVDSAQRTCKAVVCFGEAGPRFAEAFASASVVAPDCYLVGTFDEAFVTAVTLADPGDAVLLSPACASFDEFDSYEQRGATFKALVRGLSAAAHDGEGAHHG
jgi:UDP-N-acetylmuramoylalanine--D-glutamate ligase